MLREVTYSAQVTVEESLMFSAQLRLMDVSRQDLRTFVNEVIFLATLVSTCSKSIDGIRQLQTLRQMMFQTPEAFCPANHL